MDNEDGASESEEVEEVDEDEDDGAEVEVEEDDEVGNGGRAAAIVAAIMEVSLAFLAGSDLDGAVNDDCFDCFLAAGNSGNNSSNPSCVAVALANSCAALLLSSLNIRVRSLSLAARS